MRLDLGPLREWIERVAPDGTPRRKVLQILAIVLFVEGLSVIVMFSYAWVGLGILSLFIGGALLALMHRRQEGPAEAKDKRPPGLALVERVVELAGGRYAVMAVGVAVVVLVLAYNWAVSPRPELGDVDTITIFFGAVMAAYPFIVDRFKVEATFALVFLGLVVLFLALPQAVSGILSGGGVSSASSWYVHYMLAAPFSGILDLIGIPSSSTGNVVTIQFQDGTVNTLAISAYCAGMYSFSIFLSAFISFVLVFERLKPRTLLLVLGLGLLIAYLGNLIRMVIIGIVGYLWGMGALLWAHENVGWVIFLAWSSLFWWYILSRISRGDQAGSGTEVTVEPE
jgi:archaeosortase C (PEF-CTERM variant)